MSFHFEDKKTTSLDFKKLFDPSKKNALILKEIFRVNKWKFSYKYSHLFN